MEVTGGSIPLARSPTPHKQDLHVGAREIVGSYENEMMTLTIGSDGGRAYSRMRYQAGDPCGGGHRTTPESPAGWLRPVVLFIISSSSVVTVRQFLIVPIVRSLESKYWLVSFVPATPPGSRK